MNDIDSNMAANAICHAAEMSKETVMQTLSEYSRPSYLFKPKLSIDGKMWCALYGEDLQNGIAGFGESPAAAMSAFDREWDKKL